MVLGVGGAVLAALCYGVASVVQALGVRRVAEVGTGSPGVPWRERLLATRWYVAGLCLDGTGFLASLLALRTLPLFLVQTTVGASVGVTALLAAALLGVRLGRGQVLALVAAAAGLAALGASTPAEPARGLPAPGSWLLAAAVLPVAVVTLVAARRRDAWCFGGLAVAAGLGFAGVAVSARVLVLPAEPWRVVEQPALWALAGYGVQSAIAYAAALARGSVTVAATLAMAVETVVPGVVGLTLLGDRFRSGFGPVALAGFTLALGGCLWLARTGRPAPEAPPATGGMAALVSPAPPSRCSRTS